MGFFRRMFGLERRPQPVYTKSTNRSRARWGDSGSGTSKSGDSDSGIFAIFSDSGDWGGGDGGSCGGDGGGGGCD